MNKIVLSVMLSVGVFAGGELVADIEPIEYITVTEEPQASPFYLGAGIGIDNESEWDGDYSYSNLSLLAGAIIAREGNLGLALEGRATWSFDEYGALGTGGILDDILLIGPQLEGCGVFFYQCIAIWPYTFIDLDQPCLVSDPVSLLAL